MISTLQTMQGTMLILTLRVVTRTAVPIATMGSGLEHDTRIISAQMSWRFIMKCLLKTAKQQKPETKTKNNNNGNNNKPAKNK